VVAGTALQSAKDELRIVFFGTPAFAVPTLEALLASRHALVGVVTQPDRPRGRGQQTTHAPVKARAARAGLPILQPDRLRDEPFLHALAELGADIGVVAAYGRILTDAVLAVPKLGLINVHASLLPQFRGAAPVHRAIIAGEMETGVTIMRVVRALDAGPMLAACRWPIAADDTSEDVERDLARLGAELLLAAIDDLAAGRAREVPQDDSAATYAHRLTKEDGIVDWSQSANEIHNRIRGLHPWPHAFTFHHGRRLILHRSTTFDRPHSGERPGTLVEATGDWLAVATGRGHIRLMEIQSEGKRPMTAREFLAGHPMKPGDQLTIAP
jgi:methionyl-tRNA formyltransferase